MDAFSDWMYRFATDGKDRPDDCFRKYPSETQAAEKLFKAIKDDIYNRAFGKDFITINGKMMIIGYFIEIQKENEYEFRKYPISRGERLHRTPCRGFAKTVPERSKMLLRHLKYLFYTSKTHIFRYTVQKHGKLYVVYKYAYEII